MVKTKETINHGNPEPSVILKALTQSASMTEKLAGYYGRLKDKTEGSPDIALGELTKEICQIADAVINGLLRECLLEREVFLTAAAAIFRDHGLTFNADDESYCPGPWTPQDVAELKKCLGIIEPGSEESPEAAETDELEAEKLDEPPVPDYR